MAMVVTAVVLAIGGVGSGSGRQGPEARAHLVDSADLIDLEASLGHAIYWVGDRPGKKMALTRKAEGDLYLRYLPPGVGLDDPASGCLTVGTYQVADALAALRRLAAEGASRLERAPGGAAMLVASSSSQSVYLAWPGGDLEVEVYDPRPGVALKLVRSGAVRPVG